MMLLGAATLPKWAESGGHQPHPRAPPEQGFPSAWAQLGILSMALECFILETSTCLHSGHGMPPHTPVPPLCSPAVSPSRVPQHLGQVSCPGKQLDLSVRNARGWGTAADMGKTESIPLGIPRTATGGPLPLWPHFWSAETGCQGTVGRGAGKMGSWRVMGGGDTHLTGRSGIYTWGFGEQSGIHL